MRIIIIGAGPIGGIVGGRLARQGREVTLVDIDPEHVRAIRERGLQVDVPDGPFTVSVPMIFPNEITGKFDMAFIAVRSNYTTDALDSVASCLGEKAIVVSLQNGINPPALEAMVGPDRAVGAAIRMGSCKLGPGHVSTSTRGRMYVGHLSGKLSPNLETVHSLLDAVIPTEMTDNILGVLWSKLTYTCLGYFWSLADGSPRAICETERNRRLCVDFFGEVVGVGEAAGMRFVPLAEYDPLDFLPARPLADRLAALDAIMRLPKSNDRAGSLRPLKGGVKTEVDYTVAHVVREGRSAGIPTPLCESVVKIMHELEEGKRSLNLQNYADLMAEG